MAATPEVDREAITMAWAMTDPSWMIKSSAEDRLDVALDAIKPDAELHPDEYAALADDFDEYEQDGNEIIHCADFIAERVEWFWSQRARNL